MGRRSSRGGGVQEWISSVASRTVDGELDVNVSRERDGTRGSSVPGAWIEGGAPALSVARR